jgi:4-hydroxy-tetrahydrodipicolinate reductase
MSKIRIGVLGLGRTGKTVADSIHNDKNFDVVFAIKKTPFNNGDLYHYPVGLREGMHEMIVDHRPNCLVDFTTPKAVVRNLNSLPRGMSIVIGTTGFNDRELREVKSIVKRKRLKVLMAPNISDGINILMRACEFIDRNWPAADIDITEQHFRDKKDKPSGTAKKIKNLFSKDADVHIVRAGGIVGVHEVQFTKNNQKIVIKHESFSRCVFAEGAKKAVQWLLQQKKSRVYDISEVYQ